MTILRWLLYWLGLGEKPKPLSLEAWEQLNDGDYVLLLSDGRVFRGECTLWLDSRNGSHPSLSDHSWFMQLEKQIEWGRLDHLRRPHIWTGKRPNE